MNDIVSAALLAGPHGSEPLVHDQWEFVYCLSGGGEYALGCRRVSVQTGDMAAVPPRTPHACTADKESTFIRVYMAQPTLWLKEPCLIHSDGSPHLQAAFEGALYHCRSSLPAKEHLLTAYGGLIVCYLSAYHIGRSISTVVGEIEADIRSHFTDASYELEAYMRSLPFNYDYLRKLFQREMGVTPLQYLNNLRLHTAAEALLNAEGIPGGVTDVARMCGFREPLYFSRMFKKKYGLSPAYYAASVGQGVSPASEEA